MAVNNPLRLAGAELRKMSDSELEDLSRQLRLAYAQRLFHCATLRHGDNPNSFPNSLNQNIVMGDLYSNAFSYATWKSGHEHRTLGTFQDTYFESKTNTRANDDVGGSSGGGSDYPPEPGSLSSAQHRNYHFLQYVGQPGVVHLKPDNNVKRTFSYLVSKGGADIGPETDDQNIIDTVFKYTHNKMLNGDGVGTFRVATSAPGTSTHYDNWLLAQNYFYVDRISSGSSYYNHNDTTINNNYGLYLNVGASSSGSPGAILSLTQQNQPLMYRQYQTTMQSGSAILSNGSQIDDYFLEGTYRGTVYIKPTDTSGTPSWSTNNSTYTTLSVNTGPEFDTTNNHLGQNSKSTIFYPSGSSSDGYCRVRLNRALEMTIGFQTASNYGAGLAQTSSSGGSYNTSRIYKFTYEPNITQGEFTAPQTFNAFETTTNHDQYRQSNVRRLGLLCNVLLPLFENKDPNGNYNFPVYRIDSSSVDNGSTIRGRGTFTDTRENSTSVKTSLLGGTYYTTRYASGTATSVATRHLSIQSQIGVR